MAVARVNYYDTEGLPAAGVVSLTNHQNLYTAVQTLGLTKHFSLSRGFFDTPTAAIDGGNDKVDLTAIDALLDGYLLEGTGSWQFAAEGNGTYYLQVQNDGTLSKNTVENAAYLTVGTVVWTLATTTLATLTITGAIGISFTGGTGDTLMIGAPATGNLMMKDAAAKTIEDSTIAAADVTDAVSKKHTELHDMEDHTSFAYNSATSAALNFGYKAGLIRKDNAVTAVVAGTVALTDAQVNYIEVDNAGAVTANIVGFTSGKYPLHQVTAAAGAFVYTQATDDKRTIHQIGPVGSGTGDVSGPGSSTDGYLVLFDGVTGKVIKQLAVAGSAITTALSDLATVVAAESAHEADTANPHTVTAAQVGNTTPQWYASYFLTREINSVAPSVGQVYAWDGSKWTATTISAVMDISGLAAEATVDMAADYVPLYSNANGANRKMTPTNVIAPHVAAADPHAGYMLESAIVTTVGSPGSDTAYPSEQAVREAIQTQSSPSITTPTLVLPDGNGAAPTTDGQMKYDRTAEKLQIGDGTGTKVLPTLRPGSYTILNPVAGSYRIGPVPWAITITNVHLCCVGGTNVVGMLDEYDAEGNALVAAVDSSDITATAGNEEDDDGSLSNPGIAAGNYLVARITSVSGSPTQAIFSWEYNVN